MSTRNTPAIDSQSLSASAPTRKPGPIPKPSEQQRVLARLMIQEGKPFQRAAIEAGYSQNTADAGPKDMRDRSPGFAQALADESRHIPKSEEVQALAVNALIVDLRNGESRGLERTVETLGKMKVYDWFVRNSETNLGIFMAFTEAPQAEQKTIDVYQE